MAAPAQKYRFSGVQEFAALNIEQLDEMLEDIYTFLSVSPLGIGEEALNLSELGLDAGPLRVDSSGSIFSLGAGAEGAFMRQGASDPEWSTLILPNAAAQGDILYADAANTLARLAKNTTATRYLSNTGSSNNPAWAQVNLANGVTGTLPVGNGGSGNTAFTAGSVLFSNGTIITQDNASFFWDDSNDRLGLGANSSLTHRLDVRRGSNGTVARFAGNHGTEGLHLTVFDQSGFHGAIVANNAEFNGSNWIARHTAASGVDMGDGLLSFFTNTGLTAGNSFTPTMRGRFYTSGGASFLGTLSDPGSGVFRIDGSLTLTTALTVANGGSGRATATEYAVICGGTTSTGAHQSIASVGTSGQVLTSNGAAALPTFQTIVTSPTEQTTTSTGTQNDFSLSARYTVLRCNNATDLTLTGFTISGNAPTDGDRVHIYSVGAGHVYLSHQTGSTAANQIINTTTSGVTPLAAGKGSATYVYDGTTDRWRILTHNQGAWIDVAFSAGNFVGNGSMTWTVGSGDVSTQKYLLIGRLLYYNINLQNTTVGGTPNIELQVTIPNGYTVDGEVFAAARVRDNAAAAVVAMVNVPDGQTYVGFRSTIVGSTNWSAATDATTMAVLNPITFQVD